MKKIRIRIKRLLKAFETVQIRPVHLAIPSALALLASIFEGLSLGLLIPVVKGLVEGDFLFAREIPLFSSIFTAFPFVFEGRNSAVFVFMVLLVFFASIVKNLLQYAASLCTLSHVRRFSNNLRKVIYRRYLSFGKQYFDRNSSGSMQQVLVGYTEQISMQVKFLESALFQVFSLLVYLFLMFFISWRLALSVLFVFIPTYFVMRALVHRISHSSVNFARTYSLLGKKISNALSCIPLVKSYACEDREADRFNDLSDRVRMHQFSMDKKRALIQPLQELMVLSVALLLVGVMAYLYFKQGVHEIPGFLVFFVVLKRSMNTFGGLSQIPTVLASIKGPVEEVRKVLRGDDKFYVLDGTEEFKGLRNEIRFGELSFAYPEEREVLSGITFAVKRGTMTALVGPSGAGKSTLINLLMRYYDPPSDSITVDGTDIRKFTLKSYLAGIAIINQDPLLFNGSLKENIIYGLRRDVPEHELKNAIEKARLGELITACRDGLETKVGDRGIQLSGGEKQRVAVARALLKRAEIIILDEATSSLDSKTEKLIHEALEELIYGKTTIVIAHRLSTIRNADQVIVLENGRISETGTFEGLITQKKRFYEFWEEQKVI